MGDNEPVFDRFMSAALFRFDVLSDEDDQEQAKAELVRLIRRFAQQCSADAERELIETWLPPDDPDEWGLHHAGFMAALSHERDLRAGRVKLPTPR